MAVIPLKTEDMVGSEEEQTKKRKKGAMKIDKGGRRGEDKSDTLED